MKPLIRQDLFGLTHLPFIEVPAKAYFDEQRQECFDGLQRFLEYRGFAAVCGEPGTGKTMLMYCQKRLLKQSDVDALSRKRLLKQYYRP